MQNKLDYSWAYTEPHSFLICRLPKYNPPIPLVSNKDVQPWGFPIELCYTCATYSKTAKLMDFDHVGRPSSKLCIPCHQKLSDWLDNLCRPPTKTYYTVTYPLSRSVSSFESESQAIRYAKHMKESWIPFTLYAPDNRIMAHLSYRDSKCKSISEDSKKWLQLLE